MVKLRFSMQQKITTWYLTFQGEIPDAVDWPDQVQLVEAELPCPEINQFMFRAVGGIWHWYSRLNWNYQDWLDYLTTRQVRTWILWNRGTPAGYIELLKHQDQSVEIKFFGLLPQFIGQKLGSPLALAAIKLAANWQATRIWLHTCSADHPAALKNYQQAGFVLEHAEYSEEMLPECNDKQLLTEKFVFSALNHHFNSTVQK